MEARWEPYIRVPGLELSTVTGDRGETFYRGLRHSIFSANELDHGFLEGFPT